MRKNIYLFLLLVSLFIISSCVRQEASQTKSSNNSLDSKAETIEIKNALELIEKTPNSAMGYNKLAVAYIRLARETGDFSLNTKAETAVKKSLEIDKTNIEARKIKASLLLTFHKFQEGLEYGKELNKEFPKDAFIFGVLTDANVELGNYEEAVKSVQQMVDIKPNMESYARVAHVRSLHGDSEGAIEAMTTAAKIADPKDKEAQAWCLVFLANEYFKIGNIKKAEAIYDEALQILPKYHFALAGKAKALAANGEYEKAIEFYTRSQEHVPLTETVIQLGDLYTKTGDTDKAKKQYELAEAIEKDLGNIDRRRLALLWADHDINLDEALNIAKTEHANRKDIYTADVYAWTLYKKGNFEEAKKIVDEALRLKSKDAQIFYHAGMIEKELGNKKAAKEYLQRSLDTNPHFDVLQTEKAKFALNELI